jgi:hypothetical protein
MTVRLALLAALALAPGCASEDVAPPDVYVDFNARGRLPDGFVLADNAVDAQPAAAAPDAAVAVDAAAVDQ